MIVFSVLNIPIEERFMWTVAVATKQSGNDINIGSAEEKKRISINEKKCYR